MKEVFYIILTKTGLEVNRFKNKKGAEYIVNRWKSKEYTIVVKLINEKKRS